MCHWREPDSAFSPRLGGGEGGWPSLSLKIHSFLHSPTLSSPSLLSLPPSHRPSLRAWLLWRHGEHACECLRVCVCVGTPITRSYFLGVRGGVLQECHARSLFLSPFSLKKKKKKKVIVPSPLRTLSFSMKTQKKMEMN